MKGFYKIINLDDVSWHRHTNRQTRDIQTDRRETHRHRKSYLKYSNPILHVADISKHV